MPVARPQLRDYVLQFPRTSTWEVAGSQDLGSETYSKCFDSIRDGRCRDNLPDSFDLRASRCRHVGDTRASP